MTGGEGGSVGDRADDARAALRSAVRRSAAVPQAPRLAAELLRAVSEVVRADTSAVLVGGPLTCRYLAATGDSAAVDWGEELEFADDAWVARTPRLRAKGPTVGSALVLPITVHDGTVGLVVLLRRPAFGATEIAAGAAIVRPAAAGLEVALLIDELGTSAATEERRRVARETHDGVAQELATLGYRLDALSSDAELAGEPLAAELRAVRHDLSGVVRELRHTIGALRVTVDRWGGLGGALADSARGVSSAWGVPVHLTIEESSTRLPADMEVELLRIAQEAMTNARRHSGADNLWVTCRVSPPAAVLTIDDDGNGLAESRESDSFGLDIIRERAHRLGASLSIRERLPHGTRVEVIIGDRFGGAGDTGH